MPALKIPNENMKNKPPSFPQIMLNFVFHIVFLHRTAKGQVIRANQGKALGAERGWIRATFPCNLQMWRNIVCASCKALLPVLPPPQATTGLVAKSRTEFYFVQLATLKFVAWQVACVGGNTGNKALQLAKQQCWTWIHQFLWCTMIGVSPPKTTPYGVV